MSFRSIDEAINRLRNPNPLSDDDFRGLLKWANAIGEAGRYLLPLHLTWLAVDATREFEKSSRRLTRWLIGLTIVLVVLTVVIAAFTIVLAFKR